MAISLSKGIYIFDIEADALLDECTKIHCLSIGKVLKSGELRVVSTTDYSEMADFFQNKSITKIGHNIIRYDMEVVLKILEVKPTENNIIDTLPLSWYLFPGVLKHGLESWGVQLGVHKIEINDWANLSIEEYILRCETDVKINYELWKEELNYLLELYDGDEEAAINCIKYLNFKSVCVRDQERMGVRADMERVHSTIAKLESEIQPKLDTLSSLMPKVPKVSKKKKPKIMYKKDGGFSKLWLDWLQWRIDYSVPEGYDEDEIEYISGYSDANAASSIQLKKWLFDLGWEPLTFETSISTKGIAGEVPQIYDKKKGIGQVCDSIVALYSQVPELELLEGLGILKHRKSLLEGFVEEAKEISEGNTRLYGSISGYTNTLRLKHKKPLVNLPKVGLPYGEEIRGCLIADEGYDMVGCDMVNIESMTRNHYIFPYDPEYVKTMMEDPLFDSHIDIAVLAGFITKEEGELYVKIDKGMIATPTEEQKTSMKSVKNHRSRAKNCNFAATYKCGVAKLAKMTGLKHGQAKNLFDIYWKRNWAIKTIEASAQVKTVGNDKWLFNPVSKLWLSLRSDKDRFSTLNQSTAVYCFDTFTAYARKMGVKPQYQAHDEILFNTSENTEEETRLVLKEAIRLTNEQLKLNILLDVSPSFGRRYSECH